MSEIADRYRKLAAGFTARIVEVPDDQWENPAPLPGWTARDVVGHVVEATESYFPSIDRPAPDHPPVAEDPVAAWASTRDAMQAALDDHRTPPAVESSIATELCADLLLHSWDVAHACDLDEHLDPDDVHAVFEAVKPMNPALRTTHAWGPALPVGQGADEQTQLLAFLGRLP